MIFSPKGRKLTADGSNNFPADGEDMSANEKITAGGNDNSADGRADSMNATAKNRGTIFCDASPWKNGRNTTSTTTVVVDEMDAA